MDKRAQFKFYALIVLGFVIALIGILAPPIGQIHNSVIIMAGQFFVLAGGIYGCVIHFDFKNLYFHIGKMTKGVGTEECKRIDCKNKDCIE